MLTCNFNNSPLTDKDKSLQTPNLPWSNTISLLLLSLTTDSWSCLISFTRFDLLWDINSLKVWCFCFKIPKALFAESKELWLVLHLALRSLIVSVFSFTLLICSSHNPCFLFDSFLLCPPFISHLVSIYKHCLTACVAT